MHPNQPTQPDGNPVSKAVPLGFPPVMPVRETIEKKLFLMLAVVLVVSLCVLAAAVKNTFHAIESSDWVNHTHAVILEVDGILSALNSTEASVRHYLLTGTGQDEEACKTALGNVNEHLSIAKTLIANESRQQQWFARLEPLVQKRLALATQVIALRRTEGFEVARKILEAPTAAPVLTEIRELISQLKQDENGLLHQRDRNSRDHARATRYILFMGLGICFLLLALSFWLVRHDLALRRAYAAFLENANEILEHKVQERTAELALANEALTIENLERQWSQAALERLCRHNEMIIQSLGEGVCVISQLGNLLQMNPKAAELAGWQSAQLAGKPLGSILQEWGGNAPVAWGESAIHKSMKQGIELHRAEGMLVRKDGSRKPIQYNCHPFRDGGKIVGAVVALVAAE